MRVTEEEVLISVKRFMNNLLATGMEIEELPLLFKKMKESVESILEVPEYDQTS